MSGYTKLAAFMTRKHRPILRKYQHLAVRDLLYLQAELCELEYQYNKAAKSDAAEKGNHRQYYDRDWLHLATSQQRNLGGEQWAIALAIREKLREYYAAMSQYSQISSIPQPKPSERGMLHDWIENPSLGGGCGFLSLDLAGINQPSVYEAVHQTDLAILSDSHGENDLFTKLVSGPLLNLFHWFWQHVKTPLPIDPESPSVGENQSNLHQYDDGRVETVTNFLGTVFSSVAPLLSIIVLSFVQSPRARLGLVCGFTMLFTICLALATKARRVEVFAATAAFASVQVVFIGSSNSSI